MTIHYVAGFMLDTSLRHVALIKKNRPAWQLGKYNGIGGAIMSSESPIDAMVREFQEETGCVTCASDWHEYANLRDAQYEWIVHWFWNISKLSTLRELGSPTDEIVKIVHVSDVLLQNWHAAIEMLTFMPNLNWLLQMAINNIHGEDKCSYHQITEVSLRATST